MRDKLLARLWCRFDLDLITWSSRIRSRLDASICQLAQVQDLMSQSISSAETSGFGMNLPYYILLSPLPGVVIETGEANRMRVRELLRRLHNGPHSAHAALIPSRASITTMMWVGYSGIDISCPELGCAAAVKISERLAYACLCKETTPSNANQMQWSNRHEAIKLSSQSSYPLFLPINKGCTPAHLTAYFPSRHTIYRSPRA